MTSTATAAADRRPLGGAPAGTAPAPGAPALVDRLAAAAGRAVPADSAVAFRVLFGLVATYGALRFLARGWVDALYLAPANHLTYAGFEWVRPLPAPWMHAHLMLLAMLGLCIAAGYRYRLATVAFAVGFAYVELIDAALYLNHYWYVTLAAAALAVMPLHRHCSLDARAGRVAASATVPAVVLWVLRGQIAVVYLFAGIAKLNGDWLFEALPLRLWLADNADLALIGPLLAMPPVAYAASWAGALFDCTIVAWLCWRRSRPLAYVAVIGFHVLTGMLFQIGIFPVVMIGATLVFFPPDWPSRLLRRRRPGTGLLAGAAPAANGPISAASITDPPTTRTPLTEPPTTRSPAASPAGTAPAALATSGALAAPAALATSGALAAPATPTSPTTATKPTGTVGGRRWRWALAVLVVVALVQVAIPLRHLAYPGNVRWTEEGYYLSWRVMITEKAGHVDYRVRDATGAEWQVGPELVLTDWQISQATMRPDLIVATAHLIADHYRAEGRGEVEVRADAFASFNGRPHQRMLDPTVDLAAQRRDLTLKSFILPLDPPVNR